MELRAPHRDYFPFTRKDRTSDFCVALLTCVRSREWALPILPAFCKNLCGLTQPAPEVPFFSKRKEPKIRQRGGTLFGFFSGGAHPLGNFAKRSSLPLSAPPVGGYQVLHLLLRRVSGYVVAVTLLGEWGFKRGLPLSLEVSGPSGPDCVFGDFLHTRKSPRCGARSSTNRHCRNSPAMNK